MATFDDPFNRTLKFEGVTLEEVVGDPGGLTFCGISRNFQGQWPGWAVIDQYMKITPDIHAAKNFAVADTSLMALVEQFYKMSIWNANSLGDFVSQELSAQVYDAIVNLGNRAVKGLQGVLGITADGVIGPETLDSCNFPKGEITADFIINQFIYWRKSFYNALVLEKPEMKKFLTGWLSRCARSDASFAA